MLSIWLNVQGYISKYIKVYLSQMKKRDSQYFWSPGGAGSSVLPIIFFIRNMKGTLAHVVSVQANWCVLSKGEMNDAKGT